MSGCSRALPCKEIQSGSRTRARVSCALTPFRDCGTCGYSRAYRVQKLPGAVQIAPLIACALSCNKTAAPSAKCLFLFAFLCIFSLFALCSGLLFLVSLFVRFLGLRSEFAAPFLVRLFATFSPLPPASVLCCPVLFLCCILLRFSPVRRLFNPSCCPARVSCH